MVVSRSSIQAYLTKAQFAEVDVLRPDEVLIFLDETSRIHLWYLGGLLDYIASFGNIAMILSLCPIA